MLKISKNLLAAGDLICERAGYTSKAMAHIELAQERIETLLGALPLKGRCRHRTTLFHLESANALAGEHLKSSGDEGQIRLAIRRALSEAREHL